MPSSPSANSASAKRRLLARDAFSLRKFDAAAAPPTAAGKYMVAVANLDRRRRPYMTEEERKMGFLLGRWNPPRPSVSIMG